LKTRFRKNNPPIVSALPCGRGTIDIRRRWNMAFSSGKEYLP
jgi:hypothetical protein